MFSLKNKIAVITGAGSGIGKAMAVLFAKQAAVVHIIELDTAAAKANNTAIALPMPLPAPVITAILFFKLNI